MRDSSQSYRDLCDSHERLREFCHGKEENREKRGISTRHFELGTKHLGSSSRASRHPLTRIVPEKAFLFTTYMFCSFCEFTRQRTLDIPRQTLISPDSSCTIDSYYSVNNLILKASFNARVWNEFQKDRSNGDKGLFLTKRHHLI